MSIERFRLDGRVAVVTGGGGGIGAAGAAAFAAAGADVALVGRNRQKLDLAKRAVEAQGARSLVVEAEITDEAAVAAARDAVFAAFGKADILFNNAGITSPRPYDAMTLDEWRRVLDVNLTGAYLAARAFAPAMQAQGYGRIINMGSILSGRGMATRTAYCASKAALANFGAALAFEVGGDGVTVNTIGATVIVTDLNRELVRTQPELYEAIVRRTPLGRLGTLEDVTGPLVFLASPAAGFVTGQILYVDGGYTAG